jgi:hypothetical protein
LPRDLKGCFLFVDFAVKDDHERIAIGMAKMAILVPDYLM